MMARIEYDFTTDGTGALHKCHCCGGYEQDADMSGAAVGDYVAAFITAAEAVAGGPICADCVAEYVECEDGPVMLRRDATAYGELFFSTEAEADDARDWDDAGESDQRMYAWWR